MPKPGTISENDRRLVVEHLCDDLDLVQQNELAQRMQAEPALRRFYVSLARTQAALPSVLQATRQRDRRTRVIKFSTYAGISAAAAAIVISVLIPLLAGPPQHGTWGVSGTFAIEGQAQVEIITDAGAKDWALRCDTKEQGTVALTLPGENTAVDVAANTKADFQRQQDHMAWAIENGRIRADVDKQVEPLTIKTKHALATVLGTKLIMQATPKTTSLIVDHGNVSIATPDQKHDWLVTTGHRATIHENGFGIQPSLAPNSPAWPLGDHLTVALTDVHLNQARPQHAWVVQTMMGQPIMVALPDRNTAISTKRLNQAPRLDIELIVSEPGTWRLWLYGGGNSNNNTIYFGTNGTPVDKGLQAHFSNTPDKLQWASHVRLNNKQPLHVTFDRAGTHTLNLWMREDGVAVQRIYLTRDLDTPPTH